MTKEGRRIAIVRNYAELHDALRQRVDELNATRESIDAAAGLPAGYASKLFAPVPVKRVGATSLGPVLMALGVMIVLVEDAESIERISQLAKARRYARSSMPAVKRPKRSHYTKELAKLARARQIASTSPHARSKLARRAAMTRWRRVKNRPAEVHAQENALITAPKSQE